MLIEAVNTAGNTVYYSRSHGLIKIGSYRLHRFSRKVDPDTCPDDDFYPLNYDPKQTQFVKVVDCEKFVAALDQTGELWFVVGLADFPKDFPDMLKNTREKHGCCQDEPYKTSFLAERNLVGVDIWLTGVFLIILARDKDDHLKKKPL